MTEETERIGNLPTTILGDAQRIINGERQDDYGHPERHLEEIATVWSVILRTAVSAHQVALCMVGLKLVREANLAKRDNRIDGAGYLALADLVAPE